MLPVARCQTQVAFTSGQAGVEVSFKDFVRLSPEVETDARGHVGERLLDSGDRPLTAYCYPDTHDLWNSRSQNASVIRDYF
jgi:hypothetical protein